MNSKRLYQQRDQSQCNDKASNVYSHLIQIVAWRTAGLRSVIHGYKEWCCHSNRYHPNANYKVSNPFDVDSPRCDQRLDHGLVPLHCQESQSECGYQKGYHGDVIGVYELAEEAAQSTLPKRDHLWNDEMDRSEDKRRDVRGSYVQQEIVGCCSHATKYLDHSNDERVGNESHCYN